MKALTIFFVLIFALGNITNAQNDDSQNLARPVSFFVNNPKTNGAIQITNSQDPLTITGSFAINVTLAYLSKFTEVSTSIAVVNGANVLYSSNGPNFKKSSDFNNTNNQSNIKDFSLTLPPSVVSSIITSYPGAQLILRYKIYYDNSAGLLPVSGSGWLPFVFDGREFFVSSMKFNFTDGRPRATINGPDEISVEGTYQVNGAASFKVLPDQNDNTINALLTHLGSGKYIVNGKPGFIGFVDLEAINYNGLVTVKRIKINGPPFQIVGESIFCSESTYTINNATSVTLENATGIATLSNLGNGQYKVTRIGNANGEVILKATNASGTVVNKLLGVGEVITPHVDLVHGPNVTYAGQFSYALQHSDHFDDLEWSFDNNTNNNVTIIGDKTKGTVTINVGSWSYNTSNMIFLNIKGKSKCGTPFLITRTLGVANNGEEYEDY